MDPEKILAKHLKVLLQQIPMVIVSKGTSLMLQFRKELFTTDQDR